MARIGESGVEYAPWEKPPENVPPATTTGTATTPTLQTGTKPKTKPPWWWSSGMGPGSGPQGAVAPAPVLSGVPAAPSPQTWNAPWNPDPTNPMGQMASNPLGGYQPAPSPVTEQQQESDRQKNWPKAPTPRKVIKPVTYNFAGGQAAPGGTFNPTSIPGVPQFFQDPNMPPVPTLPSPDTSSGGNTWWGGGGGYGGGGGGGGGGGYGGRGGWAQSLYSLNVNR